MKKYLVAGAVCALAITAAGCGDATSDSKESGLAVEKIGEDKGSSQEAEAGETNAQTGESGEDTKNGDEGNDESKPDAGNEKAEETSDSDKAETDGTNADNTGKYAASGEAEASKSEAGEGLKEASKSESDEGSKEASKSEAVEGAAEGDLYEAFKKGTAKAKYRGTGDRASNLATATVLEKGKAYTLEEIEKAVEGADEYMELKVTGDVDFSLIDCGSDGDKELLVEIPFGDEFRLHMIIKEINGELVICYDQDSWSRSMVEVKPDGTIEGSGSGGAAIHIVDYAFVDAKGDYKYFYGCEETLTLYGDVYAYKKGEDYVTFTSEGLDQDHLGIRDYYFEADYAEREHYYSYFVVNDNYEDITSDADYDDSNELKKRFTEAGIKTYTQVEIDQMLKDRAGEIGYPKN